MGYIEFILMYITDISRSFKEVINFIGSLSASVITIYLGYLTLRKSVRFIGYTSYNSVWNGSSYGITLFNNSLTAVCINEILLVLDSMMGQDGVNVIKGFKEEFEDNNHDHN